MLQAQMVLQTVCYINSVIEMVMFARNFFVRKPFVKVIFRYKLKLRRSSGPCKIYSKN